MNVLCLGSEMVGNELAAELTRTFLVARFDGGERYRRRLDKLSAIEANDGRRILHDISVPIRPDMHVYRGNRGVAVERHESLPLEPGVRLIGIDYLSIGDEEAHRALLTAGIVALEGLDLRTVEPGSYELLCLPLWLEGSEGAPARAILLRS